MTTLLSCESLTRRFGGLTAVNDVTLSFERARCMP
jgi:ABC-type branched-subunit amino acid transport system ATPase component